jgi:hypothetical protein
MTLPIWQMLLLFVGIALLIWGLHTLTWHLLQVLISSLERLP